MFKNDSVSDSKLIPDSVSFKIQSSSSKNEEDEIESYREETSLLLHLKQKGRI